MRIKPILIGLIILFVCCSMLAVNAWAQPKISPSKLYIPNKSTTRTTSRKPSAMAKPDISSTQLQIPWDTDKDGIPDNYDQCPNTPFKIHNFTEQSDWETDGYTGISYQGFFFDPGRPPFAGIDIAFRDWSQPNGPWTSPVFVIVDEDHLQFEHEASHARVRVTAISEPLEAITVLFTRIVIGPSPNLNIEAQCGGAQPIRRCGCIPSSY